MTKRIRINISKCTGCNLCAITCALKQSGTFDQRASHIHIVQWEDICLSVPMLCQQCADAPCISACVANALVHDKETGVIRLDIDGCIHCEACATECTYQVVQMTNGLPVTCDLCSGSPQCVVVCYPGALVLEEVPFGAQEPLRKYAASLNARAAGRPVPPPISLRQMAELSQGDKP